MYYLNIYQAQISNSNVEHEQENQRIVAMYEQQLTMRVSILQFYEQL